jgi:hypothetical protein
MRYITIFLSLFLLYGCATKVDTNTLAIPQNLIQKEYYTYDAHEGKISAYFFSNKQGVLHVSSYITYIPFDIDDTLYSPFSSVKLTLDRYSKADTIEEAMEESVQKNAQRKLFLNKSEYIVDRDFAFDLIREIQNYNKKQERDDRNKDDSGAGGMIIIP